MIPSSRLILESRCTGLLCSRATKYTWTMQILNKGNQKWQEIQNLKEFLLTDRNSPNFVTSAGKLLGNASYVVTLKGETSNGRSSVVGYKFDTNSLPFGGTCDVDKRQGEALKTLFTFKCSGWNDEDKPLNYKFLHNSSDGTEITLQSGYASKASATLPVGDEKQHYTVQVLVIITDFLGSSVWTAISVKVSTHLRYLGMLLVSNSLVFRSSTTDHVWR